MGRHLASILVGDHLGQVKKILWPSGEVILLPDFAEPDGSNPVVSIEQFGENNSKFLIGNKSGDLFIFDSIKGQAKSCSKKGDGSLVKALPIDNKDIVFVYEKRLSFDCTVKGTGMELKQKKGLIKDARVCDGRLAIVGKDIPLRVFDVKTRNKIYDANPPERNWLGIIPECDVASLEFVCKDRIATCSKSDSVIRVYDIKSSKANPIIFVELNQTAFNEYAEAGRFLSIGSSTVKQSSQTKTIVVGSNVGQLIAIDLRFNVKQIPKKKLQAKAFKILGGFKGARGATLKDIKVFEAEADDEKADYKVISCCLDRYLRIHNMSKTKGRNLDKQVYMKTKPMCCSPVFYQDH